MISLISLIRQQLGTRGRAVSVAAALVGSLALVNTAEAAGKGYIVIRNLNPPHDCKVIGEGMMFIQIYAKVYGPAQKGIA